ncbi:SPOR domain-containing protein [Thalassotalea piscium]|uniref:SPOR domain-containing protein n=1 Tax=Thalassotalea piscium TaxID=1230533 RepID=A0A7X0NHN3_9GAMM|nr:SPOR domain-containing protein [Thalassotalea piscium]MBB6543530.1 hypothetical protein [Thalassotalea piscium]
MHKYLFTSLLISLLLICKAYGQNLHSVGAYSTLNTQQKGTPGIALKYQWQYNPSFALEGLLINTNTINTNTHSNTTSGKQSLLSIGAVFIKEYSPKLSIKFSSGASYVLKSSNDLFSEKSSVSPYLTLALEYKINQNLHLEAGQTSYFQKQVIGSNHSFFLGLNYLFGTTASSIKAHTRISKRSIDNIPTSSASVVSSAINNQSFKQDKHSWVIQLGAFTIESNAENVLQNLQVNPYFTHYKVVLASGLYRIYSPSFNSYIEAQHISTDLKHNHNISNLIKQR